MLIVIILCASCVHACTLYSNTLPDHVEVYLNNSIEGSNCVYNIADATGLRIYDIIVPEFSSGMTITRSGRENHLHSGSKEYTTSSGVETSIAIFNVTGNYSGEPLMKYNTFFYIDPFFIGLYSFAGIVCIFVLTVLIWGLVICICRARYKY